MPILTCNAHNCSHNRDDNCCMGGIQIGEPGATNFKHTCCRNFIATEFTNSNEVHHPSPSIHIECMATECRFNDKCTCMAEKVEIVGSLASCTEDTDCSTFVCR